MNHLALSAAAGQPATMSSREIAEILGKEHFHVARDLRALKEQLGSMFGGYIQVWRHPQNGQSYEEFIGVRGKPRPSGRGAVNLDQDTTMCLVSGYDAVVRMKIIKRWKELEASKASMVLPDFTNPVESARAWADEVEQKQLAQTALALAAPKAAFVDAYVQASSGSKGSRQVAKLLKANEREFRAFLKSKGVLYELGGEWTPYAQHIEAGRFEIRTGMADHGDTIHAYNQAKFTAKGIEWIAGEWAKHNVLKGI